MIDLHLHTTASDGRLTPTELVTRVAAAGVTVMSVTDHDTVAGLSEASAVARSLGMTFVAGIEVTAVHDARDVHVLGYFVDPDDISFGDFLREQRQRRLERLREMASRLARLGLPVDIDRLIEPLAAHRGTSVGRPMLARALVRAGHVATLQEAFERFLGAGQPAFVPRIGMSPAAVVDIIHRAGGLTSMAHPGVTRQPKVMASLVAEGLDAVEVFHSDHTLGMIRELQQFTIEHGLLATGGSDFHGDDSRDRPLGRVTLPAHDFERLCTARRSA